MRTIQIVHALALSLLLPSFGAGSPRDDLDAALQHFLQQENYSWGASVSDGNPETSGAFVLEPVEGQHETGGYTKVWCNVPPTLPDNLRPSEGLLACITDDDAHYTRRWAILTSAGWKWQASLPLKLPGDGFGTLPGQVMEWPGESSSAGAPPAGVVRSGGFTMVNFSGGWWGTWRPDQEIAVIAETIAEVTAPTSGVFKVTLTDEGVQRLVNPPLPGPIRMSPLRFHVENPSLSVTMQASSHVIQGYSLKITGVLVVADRRKPIEFTKTRNLTDFGTTRIELPENIATLLKD